MANPVLLLHGFTGSVTSTWQPTGIMDLLREGGREVIAWDLPGHGSAPKHHDPAGYVDMEAKLVERGIESAFADGYLTADLVGDEAKSTEEVGDHIARYVEDT